VRLGSQVLADPETRVFDMKNPLQAVELAGNGLTTRRAFSSSFHDWRA
jgi:hypothetical protein